MRIKNIDNLGLDYSDQFIHDFFIRLQNWDVNFQHLEVTENWDLKYPNNKFGILEDSDCVVVPLNYVQVSKNNNQEQKQYLPVNELLKYFLDAKVINIKTQANNERAEIFVLKSLPLAIVAEKVFNNLFRWKEYYSERKQEEYLWGGIKQKVLKFDKNLIRISKEDFQTFAHIQPVLALRKLEKNGYLKIQIIDFDLDAQNSRADRNEPFYPQFFWAQILVNDALIPAGKVAQLEFDTQNRTFILGSRTYKIQSAPRFALVKKLWEEREEMDVKTKKVLRKGKMFPKDALAVQAGIIGSSREFNKTVNMELKTEITELNRIFRQKNFPIKIRTATGVQMIRQVGKI